MKSVHCALLEVRRKKTKYILLFMIFTILFMALLSGKILYASVLHMRETVLAKIGACIEINGIDEEGEVLAIPEEWKEKIEKISGVEGMNQHFSNYALLQNGENVKLYEGADPYEQIAQSTSEVNENMVVLDANLDCQWMDNSRTENIELLEGEYPNEEKEGLLIEQHLADTNGFHVGNELRLQSSDGRKLTAPIIGIYKTKGTFKITEDNFAGTAVFAWSPYNRIYSSLNIGCELFQQEKNGLSLHVYVDDLDSRQYVMNQIKEIIKGKKGYTVADETEESYKEREESMQIEVIERYTRMIILYSLCIGLVLLSLILNLYLQYYYRDAGILVAMGAGRWRIIGQFLIAAGMVILLASVSSAGVTRILIKRIADMIMDKITLPWTMVTSFDDGLSNPVPFTLIYPGRNTYIGGVLTVIAFWMASCIPLLIRMIRFSPRSLFGKDER